MKQDIHPNYGPAKVICACGEIWEINSTRPEYKVGICAKCHPFFTGKQKFVDTAGRIDKFNKRYGKKADWAWSSRGFLRGIKAVQGRIKIPVVPPMRKVPGFFVKQY